jgi:hypothetical protein
MALKGHAPTSVGGTYGDWPVDVLAKEIAKLPALPIDGTGRNPTRKAA